MPQSLLLRLDGDEWLTAHTHYCNSKYLLLPPLAGWLLVRERGRGRGGGGGGEWQVHFTGTWACVWCVVCQALFTFKIHLFDSTHGKDSVVKAVDCSVHGASLCSSTPAELLAT